MEINWGNENSKEMRSRKIIETTRGMGKKKKGELEKSNIEKKVFYIWRFGTYSL